MLLYNRACHMQQTLFFVYPAFRLYDTVYFWVWLYELIEDL